MLKILHVIIVTSIAIATSFLYFQ